MSRAAGGIGKPTFFATPAAFRGWLARHYARARELWVGFHKRDSGRPSITWPESVDAALCYGWIDGVRKSLGAASYMIRFSPRRARSTWSLVNLRRARVLTKRGLMRPAGRAAFAARDRKRSGLYSFENRPRTLGAAYQRRFKARPQAWAFFRAQAPWYRRTTAFWVVSAKQEATRLRRLETLIECSAQERTIPQLTRKPPAD